MIERILTCALMALVLYTGGASAAPTYVGKYGYISFRCDAYYGPFTSEETAWKAAARAEYEVLTGCFGAKVLSSFWATPNGSVWACGGSYGPTYVEGVERTNMAQYSIEYRGVAASGCDTVYQDGLSVQRGRIVCGSSQMYFTDINNCDTVDLYTKDPGGNPKNNGPNCPSCDVGDPINPYNGNNWRVDTDYASATRVSQLRFDRFYNSNQFSPDANTQRMAGVRWTTNWDRRLTRIKLPQSSVEGPTICYKRRSNGEIVCTYPPLPTVADPDLAATRPNGKVYMFRRAGETFVGDADVIDRIRPVYASDSSPDGWEYLSAASDELERYDKDGALISITARSGAVQLLTYSNGATNDTTMGRHPAGAPTCLNVQAGVAVEAGKLLCVSDQWGRQINFEYDEKGRVVKMIDPALREYQYVYDGPSGGCQPAAPSSQACGSGNLTMVVFPDGKTRTYSYNESAFVNAGVACPGNRMAGGGFAHLYNSLTGLTDELGTRYASWTYDCLGRATSNTLAGDVAKVALSYGEIDAASGARTSTVSGTLGRPANPVVVATPFSFKTVLGTGKVAAMSNPCSNCGAVASRTYDANGNVATTTDWNGQVVRFGYDLARNLEMSRTEAHGTPQARTTTTEWHPTYRLPLRIAEAGRLTTFEYDSAGNLLSKSIRATSDGTGAGGFAATPVGAARVWSYTYDTVGQMRTVLSPRADVVSKTTFDYDARGNLVSVTNAAGHQTVLTNYDVDGRPGRVTEPNGLSTDLYYSPRGWLTSSISGAETTTFQHDNAGQLQQVTRPDGSKINYSYDDAHRLTGIADTLGNSVTYTLDLFGNRIAEQVRDPAGVLTRQTTRVFDLLNRVKQITGAEQ